MEIVHRFVRYVPESSVCAENVMPPTVVALSGK
jgi:hypothetical protein